MTTTKQGNDMSEQQSKNPTELATILGTVGEVVAPGGSLVASGQVCQGLVHFVGGILAKAVFGMPGLLLVHANALSRFHSGKHLHQHLRTVRDPPDQDASEAAPARGAAAKEAAAGETRQAPAKDAPRQAAPAGKGKPT